MVPKEDQGLWDLVALRGPLALPRAGYWVEREAQDFPGQLGLRAARGWSARLAWLGAPVSQGVPGSLDSPGERGCLALGAPQGAREPRGSRER